MGSLNHSSQLHADPQTLIATTKNNASDHCSSHLVSRSVECRSLEQFNILPPSLYGLSAHHVQKR